MFDAIKPLVDSGIINEETKAAISEAWDSKLNEARDQIRAEMRNEFAGRYEHDKGVMVEALDKMVSESLQAEIREFADEKAQLSADRVRFNKRMAESAGKFDQFLVGKLAEEIKELREDRKQYQNSIKGLEKFVVKSLAEEIQEFAKDKQEVVETKVKLVREAKQKLASLQKQFVTQSANLVKESVAKNLESEMTQLKEDIQIARENNFGRRLFEAFASEFAITHLNENTQISKLTQALKEKEQLISEARTVAAEKAVLVESKDREIKIIKESQEREATLNKLLKSLNKEKQTVMVQLLENVQTEKLNSAFEKYLPAVLNNSTPSAAQKPAMLAESRMEVTGDKTAKVNVEHEYNNVVEIKRLAGLK
jgi:DNA repair exonuclease SbcCD ATPase subunit